MFACLPRRRGNPRTAAGGKGARLRRIGARLAGIPAAVGFGLLAPPVRIPTGLMTPVFSHGGPSRHARVTPTRPNLVHQVPAGAIPGWQIIVIALVFAVGATTVTVLRDRALDAARLFPHRPPELSFKAPFRAPHLVPAESMDYHPRNRHAGGDADRVSLVRLLDLATTGDHNLAVETARTALSSERLSLSTAQCTVRTTPILMSSRSLSTCAGTTPARHLLRSMGDTFAVMRTLEHVLGRTPVPSSSRSVRRACRGRWRSRVLRCPYDVPAWLSG